MSVKPGEETQEHQGEEAAEATAAAGIDVSVVRAFIAEAARIKEAEIDLKAAKAELEISKTEILDGFAAEGIGRITVDGKTVYTHQQLWAGKAQATAGDGTPAEDDKGKAIKVDNDVYIAAIKEAGLDEFVKETANSSTLSSWVRGIEEMGEDDLPILPEALRGIVQITEKFDVRIRKG